MEESKASNIFPIQITIVGKADLIEGQLIRTLGPRIVEKILAKLPITDRASKRDNQVNLPINIKMGKEKASNSAKKGDIAYWPLNDALSIFLDDSEVYGGINIIGNITSNLDALNSLRLINTLKINQK